MIENFNSSTNPSNGEFVDVKKYVGVASVGIVAINPDNAKLRAFGWNIQEGADEPKYITDVERNGKPSKLTRIRFLVQIQDLPEKPVIPLDFTISPHLHVNKTSDKCEIIDAFGRTAWATLPEYKAHRVPHYANGDASISADYKGAHEGERDLITFLFRFLNITPLQVFNNVSQSWKPSEKPGKLTIDDWNALCNGDITELADYISRKPENRVKVILGVRTTDTNRTYQTFLKSTFLSNGSFCDKFTGEYTKARKEIDKYLDYNSNATVDFSALPVKEWSVTASSVQENTEDLTDTSDGSYFDENPDDLPFA